MRFGLSALTILLGATAAFAELKTEVIDYKHGDTPLEGYLAYDDSFTGKRPGILVCHEWSGHNAYARKRAEQLAALGYVAFALDMYGKGVLAKDPKEAAEKAAVFKNDRMLMRAVPWPAWTCCDGCRRLTPTAWPPSAIASAAPRRWNWRAAGPTWPAW